MHPPAPQSELAQFYQRYSALCRYVGWDSANADLLRASAPLVLPHLDALIDDFYREIERHEETRQRITGGPAQIARLKGTLADWLRDLLRGDFDEDYVARRWAVGWRHVQIGLRQVYVNAAVSRLRTGILSAIHREFQGDGEKRFAMELAVSRALDMDLAIIQDAYEAEKHLRSEAAFRSLVEAADCAIFILREDDRIAYLNPFAERITGLRLSEVEGADFLNTLVSPEDRDSFAGVLQDAVRDEPELARPVTILAGQATRRQIVWNFRRLDDFDGAPAMLAVGHDITELQQAQDRALQSQRLAAIGQTMTGLAHESRNAFQRIQACLEMLEMEVEDRPEALELVERIQRAQNHLHHLNEEVRNYAAPIRLETQRCELPPIWREAWHHLELNHLDKRLVFRELPAKIPVECHVDPFAIGQVFRNVLENAIAASPDEGVIEVAVKEAVLEHDRPAVEVVFLDHGPGLSAEARELIFEPFFTTKTKGTGLGMAIVKRIVEAHRGVIRAETSGEGGAQIAITLPVARS